MGQKNFLSYREKTPKKKRGWPMIRSTLMSLHSMLDEQLPDIEDRKEGGNGSLGWLNTVG